MEQYMAEATPDSSISPVELKEYFSAWVDLVDSEKRIKITMILNFPKKAACDIYEGIFREVDIEQVCGVVQELANIIGGIVKPEISPFSREIAQLIPEAKDLPREINLTWDLGLPESKMGEDHSIEIEVNGMPKLHVPFQIKDETFHCCIDTKVLMLLVAKYKARVASVSFAHPCSLKNPLQWARRTSYQAKSFISMRYATIFLKKARISVRVFHGTRQKF